MRRDLMEILYARLPDRQSRVLPNKKVTGVEQDDSSVTVTCADGSVFKGDMLIGCDGVHSAVQRFALKTGDSKASPKAEYCGLFGSSPRPDGIPPCQITETHDSGIVFMILSTQDRSFWLVTHLKEKGAPEIQKYSDEDAQALADKFAGHSVAPGAKVTFGELWRTRSSVGPGMYDYLEGITERWYHGRVVVVGDAAHKVSSKHPKPSPILNTESLSHVPPDDAKSWPRGQQCHRVRSVTHQPAACASQRETQSDDS